MATAAQAEIAPLPGHVSLQGFGGSDRGGAFSAWIPVIQGNGAVSWASPYAVFGDNGTAAGFGVGYRAIGAPGWALGTYAFIDGSAATGEGWLWSGTVGVEALSSELEARANLYVPLSGSTIANSFNVPSAILTSDNMLEITRGHRIGAYGVDGEVGYRVARWGTLESGDGLRGFAGAYTSWRNGLSASGVQGRLEAKFTAASGVSLKLSGGVSSAIGGSTAWGMGARFSMPLGAPQALGGGGSDGVAPVPLDTDAVHHLGGPSLTYTANEAAYFVNGRATGKVYYADGDADTNEDGLSVPHATALTEAISRAGVNGVVVAVGDADEIVTTGDTLQTGQALIAGGAYLPLAAADGTTGFAWHADGTQGDIVFNATSGFALTLSDYNSVIGLKIESGPSAVRFNSQTLGAIDGASTTGAWITDNEIIIDPQATSLAATDDDETGAPATGGNSDPAVFFSQFIGVNLLASTNALVANNKIDVYLHASSGRGGNAVGGDGTALTPDGGEATGGAAGNAVDSSTVFGLAIDDSTGANVHDNTIKARVVAEAGAGGEATGGDGYSDGGEPGAATGGSGGIAINNSTIRAISMEGAEGARVDNNNATVDVTATGGNGGDATGGDAGTEELLGHVGGAANSGNGGIALLGSDIAAIYAKDVSAGTTITNNTVAMAVQATGGAGGNAKAGAGGSNDDYAGSGGDGTGGFGGDAIGDGTTIFGIDALTSDGATISGNTVGLTILANGGDGGMGDGGAAGNAPNPAGSGGDGNGGDGGAGFSNADVHGISITEANDAILTGNRVTISVSAEGGAGGAGSGAGSPGYDDNRTAKGGDGAGGNGGAGIYQSVVAGDYADESQRTHLTDETIAIIVDATGGIGGSGTGSPPPSSTNFTAGGNGGSGRGGNGGDALDLASVEGLQLQGTADAMVAGASILIDGTVTGGNGGFGSGATGGGGVDAGDGGVGTGGNGGSISTAYYAAVNAAASDRLSASNVNTSISVDITAGQGGYGLGGRGGDGTNAGDGGIGLGGSGGNVAFHGRNVDLSADTHDIVFSSSVSNATYTIAAGKGGEGHGGDGGDGSSTPGAGGDAYGGQGGGFGLVNLYGFSVDNSHNVTLAVSTDGQITGTGNAGDAGNATGGDGGSSHGAGGEANVVAPGASSGFDGYDIYYATADNFVITGTVPIGLSISSSQGNPGTPTEGATGP